MQNDEPDFSGKKVAFFGAGDQESHGEEFVTALGAMHDLFGKLGATTGFGYWSTDGYDFKHSGALRRITSYNVCYTKLLRTMR